MGRGDRISSISRSNGQKCFKFDKIRSSEIQEAHKNIMLTD